MGNVPEEVKGQLSDKEFIRTEAIINSMTAEERRFPDIIKGSRKRRIAAGSGTQVQDVNRLLKQFDQMQRMMKKMSKGGLGRLMKGLGGRFPARLPFE
jgi:signal recognition particle subunit SRP54